MVARKFYNEPCAGFSIPAAEHSTITSWGSDREIDAYKNMLTQYPTGLVAVVSDSYDIFKACDEIWGGVLKEQVLARDGTLVIRPDSGNPPEIVVKVLNILGDKFGYGVNGKGFKILSPKVRVIQGDGIDYKMLGTILEAMKTEGWSADNIAFGSGGGLLQKLNRDTLKFAFKCASVVVDGVRRKVSKNPVTDNGKQSKAGRMKLTRLFGAHGSAWRTLTEYEEDYNLAEDYLVEVFRDGEILKTYDFENVRKRAAITIEG